MPEIEVNSIVTINGDPAPYRVLRFGGQAVMTHGVQTVLLEPVGMGTDWRRRVIEDLGHVRLVQKPGT